MGLGFAGWGVSVWELRVQLRVPGFRLGFRIQRLGMRFA